MDIRECRIVAIAGDCKSLVIRLRRFESYHSHSPQRDTHGENYGNYLFYFRDAINS